MRTRIAVISSVLAFAAAATLTVDARSSQTGPVTPDAALLKSYHWRSIGPMRAGRSLAVSGVKGQPKIAYAGQTGGGLWKTVDGGETWNPVTDGQVHSGSVGSVAVAETDPNIVYIGMGEGDIRGNIQPGDGVYKSTDAGKTWTQLDAFRDSDAIPKIRINPTNPDVVFVADFGKYSVPSAERGVFKSTDGGKTWRKVLFRDDKTGAIDVEIDRNNPNVMFAALWEAWRKEYSMSSGGPGCGLFKSTDGGEHWTEITRNPGLPKGVDGKIGVAISPADSNRVYALVENADGGLFSSDDAGATWKLVNSGHNIRQRAFYYTHVFADPKNKDIVFAENVGTFWSHDGGKTFVSYTGGDSHDLWIDPDDPNHIVHANDSGGAVSFNAETDQRTFSARDYATGQFYHVITTKHVPYHVCGAQQDSSTICVSSAPTFAGRGGGGGFGRGGAVEPYSVGGAEPGYIAPDPKDPDVYYAGGNNGSFLTRLDRRSGNEREVGPYPREFSGEASDAVVERWQWTYPIIFSPADPNVLFASSQHVWRTRDGGVHWDKISGDLTRHDPKTMGPSGGPITHDMNSPEIYATVFALGPGKKDVNILWAGSDDGLIHVTQDGGKTWANVTPQDMPDLGRVSQIDASSFDNAAAYVAVKKPLLNDYAPYIFRTHDFGKTWTKIVAGIAPNDYVHVVREDPTRQGLLYAGTQHGFYISYDDGDHWQPMALNLPDTQVSDIWVEADSLAISTHGRGFYVLDDINPLRQAGQEGAGSFHLYKPADVIRTAGPLTISYTLHQPAQKLTVEILDGKGAVIDTINGGEPGASTGAGRGGRGRGGRGAAPADAQGFGRGRGGPQIASMAAGFNKVTWDARYPDAVTFPGMILWGATTNGPVALPGAYQVRLTVDGQSQTQSFNVLRHPLEKDVTDADLQEQFNLALQIRDKVTEANNAVIAIRRIKDQVDEDMKKAPPTKKELKLIADRLTAALSAVEAQLYQVKNESGQDPLNYPIKTNNRLASLLGMTERGAGPPTANIYPIFEDLKKELKGETDQLEKVYANELKSFNIEAGNAGLEPITIKK